MEPPAAAVDGFRRTGIVLAVAVLLLGLPTLLFPYGRDQAMFAYVGRVWREGGLPYRDAWDVKLPGIYAVYALVGGAAWGPRLLDLLAVAVGAAALVVLTRRTSVEGGAGRVEGVGPAPPQSLPVWLAVGLLVVFTFGALDYWNLAQAETLIGPLAALAMAAGLSGLPLLAGVLLGAAVSLKTTAVLFVFPAGAAVLLDERGPEKPLRRAFLFILGAALVPAGFLLYFALRRGIPYLLELIQVQSEYAGGDPRTAGLSPTAMLRTLGLEGYLPLVAASGTALIPWLRDRTLNRSIRWAVALWWGSALLQIVVQRRFYLYHWSVLTPAAAFLAAYGFGRWWNSGQRAERRWLAVGLLVLGVVGPLMSGLERIPEAVGVLRGQVGLETYQRRFSGVFDYSVADGMDAARHVAAQSTHGDRLLVLGFEPHVYLYADRAAPSRHASDAPLFGETSIPEARRRAWLTELVGALERNPPLYFVEWEPPAKIARPEWAQVLNRFRFRYYHEEGKYGRFRVYRRRAGPAPFVDTPLPQG